MFLSGMIKAESAVRRVNLMKKSTLFILIIATLLVLSGCERAVVESPAPSEIVTVVMLTATALQTEAGIPSATNLLVTTPTPTPTVLVEMPEAMASELVSNTPSPTLTPSPTPMPTAKPTPRPTKRASITPTPKPASTFMPAATSEPSGVIPMSSSYKNAVLSGVNYVRMHNGEYAADAIDRLDSSLSAKAQKHAEEMAAKGEIFHSSWGPESVACGDLGNGESAGVRSAVHAAGLLDPEITRIGVGAAKSVDGTIFLCVDGGK
jgi:uncharacterized protein YkwD